MIRLLLMLAPLFTRLLLLNPDGEGEGGAEGEGQSTGGEGGAGAGSAGQQNGNDDGFPPNTPVAQMTAEQQAAYWKHYARQHENRNREILGLAGGSFDELKAKVTGYDEHVEQSKTETQRAIDAARAEGREQARRESAASIVDAHIEAAVMAERLTREQADLLLGTVDRSKLVTIDGDDFDVDTDKVAALISTVAPAKGGNGDGKGGARDLGQGRRDGGAKLSGRDIGHAEAQRRFGDRAGAST